MTARDDIFSNIRRSLGVTGTEVMRRQTVANRLASSPRGIIPQRGQLDPAAQRALFKQQAETAQASVSEVASYDEVPQSVAEYLRSNNLPATLKMGSDSRLVGLNWSATALDISHGRSHGDDLNGLSHAFAGVAETGTLIMASGPDNPTTLNFLPDNHIVIVAARDIAGDYESVWSRLRERFGKGVMPRTVNMITGPSRSADIEQTLLLGAHGPRRLHIILVGADKKSG